ncbi:hypothetical protein F2P56_023488 [Juglans regia]|uniref:Uncharacterized protein n=1 Tax=Juglans regia TaxID=51240 RepID=A0A833TXK0_JUGRE|nr:hypothetical protein F2P56_023488 [Juglans regia]
MEDFRIAVMDCGLVDMGYIGSKFTWCNKREGYEVTKYRLDRALVNEAWLNLFVLNQVFVLPVQCSDHNPILIQCTNPAPFETPKQKVFRCEVAWGNREGCMELIKTVW